MKTRHCLLEMIVANLMILAVSTLLVAGCTGKNPQSIKKIGRKRFRTEMLYTRKAAMDIYAYQPERALKILDSAVIVGNVSDWQADLCRARIYSSTLSKTQIDSLLGGARDISLDTARSIGERLLSHDSIKADLKRQQEVLEILSYTARMKNDTTGWIKRSYDYIEICHKLGPQTEADALRTEAEIGAALFAMGQEKRGMAKLDSAINQLDAYFYREQNRGTFDELDALILALKRKIVQLGSHGRDAETLPLSRLIIERLDDYEQHPEKYKDGSHREPGTNQKRADYINFYRGQAQNYITAAYVSLGEHTDMLEAFKKIEDSVREATAREHIARYNALQEKIKAERMEAKTRRANHKAIAIGIFALMTFAFAVIVSFKNRAIKRKNHILAQQITETLNYKKMYWDEKQAQNPVDATDPNTLNDEQLFQYINDVIVREKLFTDPKFERQTIMDRFQLSKERVGAVFSRGNGFSKLTGYIQQLRLEYAAKLLIEQQEMSIVQIASKCGFSSNTYFSDRFRMRYSMKPSEFRKAKQ